MSCPRTGNTGNAFDYNLYYSAAGSAGSLWQWDDGLITGFTAWKAEIGGDPHSRFGLPLFKSTSTPDLHLQRSSPAVNAMDPSATTMPGEQDIDGRPRRTGTALDLGADELSAYDAWCVDWFGAQAGNSAITAPSADPDLDHVKNIEEYLYATNPMLASSERFYIAGVSGSASSIRFRRSRTALDLVYGIQWSPNLFDWFDPDPLHALQESVIQTTPTYDWMQANLTFPPAESRQFYRMILDISP
ncbi:MAG: choice-of-anchor Q domain-containing protein [Kiritimatiellia bacterium]